MEELVLKGIPVSGGIAVGLAAVVKYELNIPSYEIPPHEIKRELLRFDAALAVTREQLKDLMEKAEGSEETSKILQSQILVLTDPLFVGEVVNRLRTGRRNVEEIVNHVMSDFFMQFQSMKDPYLKERAYDLKDVGGRILRNLMGRTCPVVDGKLDGRILVCDHLNASEFAHLDMSRLAALVCEIGGATSHPSILARSVGIPAVVGIENATDLIPEDARLVVDALEGLVIVNPSEETLERYEKRRSAIETTLARLRETSCELEPVTRDGVEIEFLANISVPQEVEMLGRFGAAGVGLYRTEYLFMNSPAFPTEDEQYEAYSTVVRSASPGYTVIRTLDVGGDKHLPYLCFIEEERNPFLGWRSIRFCLDNEEIFKTQLRALLRAASCGDLRIMFPMISRLDDLFEARRLLREAEEELKERGTELGTYRVGVMVEVPSAVMMVDRLLPHVDFLSIGTNDLVQYMLAVDRTNRRLAERFEELEPAVLRAIKMVVDAAEAAAVPVSCCGEMAASPKGLVALMGLGLRRFSMSLFNLPQSKEVVRAVSFAELRSVMDELVRNADTAAQVRKRLRGLLESLELALPVF